MGFVSVMIVMFVGGLREISGWLCLEGTIVHIIMSEDSRCSFTARDSKYSSMREVIESDEWVKSFHYRSYSW